MSARGCQNPTDASIRSCACAREPDSISSAASERVQEAVIGGVIQPVRSVPASIVLLSACRRPGTGRGVSGSYKGPSEGALNMSARNMYRTVAIIGGAGILLGGLLSACSRDVQALTPQQLQQQYGITDAYTGKVT